MDWKTCERCKRATRRRFTCAICKRLVCRDCVERPRQRGNVDWCAARNELGPLPDDCREPPPARAARRDASFFSCPGRSTVYHITNDGETLACDTRMPIYEPSLCDPATVRKGLRCMRPGCKARWT